MVVTNTTLKFHRSWSQISKGCLPNYHPIEEEAQEDQATNTNEEPTHQRNQGMTQGKAGTPGKVFRDSFYDAGKSHIPVTCSLLPHKVIWTFLPKMWDIHYSVWLGFSHISCGWWQYTPQNASIPTTWCTTQLYD